MAKTDEERQALLEQEFPKTLKGMVRPDEPIPTDFAFHTDLPQFMQADPVLYTQENLFLRQLLSNDKITQEQVEAIQSQLANCDLRIVTEVLKGLMSPDMLKKLNGIQAGALNNPHPATHPATMITQDATHRFATDAEKTTWNGKANASHGQHTPAKETANNARFLRNDATWQTVTPGNIGAYTKSEIDGKVTSLNNAINGKANTSHGNHVPGTQSANNAVYLRNDNTWQTVTAAKIGAAAASHTHDDRYYTEGEVNNLLGGKANLNSPALTGTPTAPTAATATNNTQLATTAFVKAAITSGGGGIVAASLAQNGYVKFANGLILQWGRSTINTFANTKVNFPISFNKAFVCVGCASIDGYSGGSARGAFAVSTPTNIDFTTSQGDPGRAVAFMAFGT